MVFDVWSVLILVGLVALVLGELWVVIPKWKGLPSVSTSPTLIRRAMQLADVQPGETVYDLGAGDGRALIIAAREFRARAVGVEIEPLHCIVAWFRALLNGVLSRVSIRRQDLFQTSLDDADVLYLYLNPDYVEALRPYLMSRLRPGARVISVSFPFDGWQPADMDIGHLIFLYRMPPTPGSIETFLRSSIT